MEQEVEDLRSEISKAQEERLVLQRENELLRGKMNKNADEEGMRMMQDTNEFLRGELLLK